MQLKPEQISRIIRSQIKYYENAIEQTETGTVTMVGDGIARAAGLDNCMAGELVQFPERHLRHGAEPGGKLRLHRHAWCSDEGIQRGRRTVKRTGKVVSVPVGEELIGRVVNALGQPIDGKGPIEAAGLPPPSSRPAPGIIRPQARHACRCRPASRPSTRMIPIGRGQRELIIGDRQTGKTAIATDTIINQKGKDVHLHLCRHRPEALYRGTRWSSTLDAGGAMDYTIVVSATASELAPLAVHRALLPAAPWASTS